MKKRQTLKCLVAAIGLGLGLASVAQAQATWKPNKPINLIVPWAAGGSTDQVSRIAAAELEKVLGQKIVVVNQPGAAGSIGTKNAWEAPRMATPGQPAPRKISALISRWACSTPASRIGIFSCMWPIFR